ncbi:glutaredoxin family protein [SAR92 clade bacterium H231]|jgi:glutaredoxin|nr:glutaredoxin family protein [SAR92 clade bacterium H231]
MHKPSANQLIIYTGPNCHLCEQAKALLYPLMSERGLTLMEVDIHTDAELQQKYGIRIPVVLANGQEKGWPFTAAQIGRLLDI